MLAFRKALDWRGRNPGPTCERVADPIVPANKRTKRQKELEILVIETRARPVAIN